VVGLRTFEQIFAPGIRAGRPGRRVQQVTAVVPEPGAQRRFTGPDALRAVLVARLEQLNNAVLVSV